MNRFIYFVVPLAGLLIFGGYYFGVFYKGHKAEVEAAEAKAKADAETAAAVKKAAEEQAQAEAKARMEEKKRQDEEKEAKKLADRAKTLQDLQDEITAKEKRVTELTKEHADLEVQLLEIRRVRETEQKKAFDSARAVELAKIDRRNAELEIQLNTEKMATRVEATSLVEMPIFPTPPAATEKTTR